MCIFPARKVFPGNEEYSRFTGFRSWRFEFRRRSSERESVPVRIMSTERSRQVKTKNPRGTRNYQRSNAASFLTQFERIVWVASVQTEVVRSGSSNWEEARGMFETATDIRGMNRQSERRGAKRRSSRRIRFLRLDGDATKNERGGSSSSLYHFHLSSILQEHELARCSKSSASCL
jgi:hypothetical protein